MKSILFIVGILFSNNLLADWYCNAYCNDKGEFKLLTERAEHPVEALQQIIKKCAEATYGDEIALIKVYSEPSGNSDQATVENACKFIDITKY